MAERATAVPGPRHRWARTTATAVAALLTLGLAACGDKDQQALQAAAAQVQPAGGAQGDAPAQQEITVRAATTLTVTPVSARIPYGAPAIVRITLAGVDAAGERVAVRVGDSMLTATTDSAGAATLDMPVLAPGPQTISAEYAGSAEAMPATGRAAIDVDPAGTTIALTLTPGGTAGTGGTAATIATAAVDSATGVPAEGTVTVEVAGTPLPAVPLTAGSAAVEIAPTLAVGDHAVTAVFAPADPARFAASTATSVLSVAKAPTSVIVAGTKETIRYGDWASFQVTVQSPVPGADLTGAVSVSDGGGVVAEGSTDAAGRATLEFLNRAVPGPTPYTVTFAGSDAVAAAQGELVVQTSQTNVDLAIDHPDTLPPGSTATITLSVIGTPDAPTGAATITVGGAQIAAAELAGGQLTGTTGALPAGDHAIAVSYAGDARFQPNQATSTLSVIEPPANPNAAGAAALQASNPCPASAVACVDLSNEQAWLQSGGQITYGPVPITSGMSGYRTPPGMFAVSFRDADHKSSLFNDAPMPNSVFFNGGIAFHAGSLYDQSHGCIHLSWDASVTFFDALPPGTPVFVFGAAPY